MVALTDQAIAKIKDLIMSGEFAADSKLPEGAGARPTPRPVAKLAPRGGAGPDPDRRPRAARRRRHLRDEPRARAPPHRAWASSATSSQRRHPARAPPGAPYPRARRDRYGGHAADGGRLRRPRALPRADGCGRDDPGIHRRRRGVPPDHRHRLGQLDARLADPAPLRRDAAGEALALGHRAGRDRDDEAAAPGHLRRPAGARRRARQRSRPDPPLRRRAVAQAHARGRRGRIARDRRSTTRAPGASASARASSARQPGPGEVGSTLPSAASAARTSTSPTATWTTGYAYRR